MNLDDLVGRWPNNPDQRKFTQREAHYTTPPVRSQCCATCKFLGQPKQGQFDCLLVDGPIGLGWWCDHWSSGVVKHRDEG